MISAILAWWPLALIGGVFVGGVSTGWILSTRSLRLDAKDGHAVYLGDTAYRLVPVDLDHQYETEQRRLYGTMAEQSW